MNEAADHFEGPGTRQVLSEGTEISDPLVTRTPTVAAAQTILGRTVVFDRDAS